MVGELERLGSEFSGWGSTLDVPGFIDKVSEFLSGHDIDEKSTRLVLSVCPDDINRLRERKTIENALVTRFNGEFHLGSLAGYPIDGVTGLSAASHHAPECKDHGKCKDGNLLLIVSAHFGLTNGESPIYGQIIRPGQEHSSACCGAMMGFLNKLVECSTAGSMACDMDDTDDIAKQILFNELVKTSGDKLDDLLKITNNNKRIIELSKINCEVILKKVQRVIQGFFKSSKFEGKIALIGGITVNASYEDFFILKNTEIHEHRHSM